MILTETFNEFPTTFSDKKIIADDFKHILKRVRIGRITDIIFVLVVIISSFLGIESFLYGILITVILTYLVSLILTEKELKKEFKEKVKLVGSFKILDKKSSRAGHFFVTKSLYIKVSSRFHDKAKVGDSVNIEKFPNERVFKVEVL